MPNEAYINPINSDAERGINNTDYVKVTSLMPNEAYIILTTLKVIILMPSEAYIILTTLKVIILMPNEA